jgi:hypothetical protein
MDVMIGDTHLKTLSRSNPEKSGLLYTLSGLEIGSKID